MTPAEWLLAAVLSAVVTVANTIGASINNRRCNQLEKIISAEIAAVRERLAVLETELRGFLRPGE